MPPLFDARRRLEELCELLQRTVSAATLSELVESRAALERIDRGTYGRCQSCGGAIGRQRLLALPAARYCIACAAAARP